MSKMIAEEKRTLREELRHLKGCQMSFLTTAFTSTGLIFALARWAQTNTSPSPLAYFFPLAVVLPASWFFFDKAKSITRIVGYYRILEHAEAGLIDPKPHLGWENALAKFRAKAHRFRKEVTDRPRRFIEFRQALSPRSMHAYWSLSLYTFFALSFLPSIIAFVSLRGAMSLRDPIVLAATALSLLSFYVAARNLARVWRLTVGEQSYDANYELWKRVLHSDLDWTQVEEALKS